MYIVHTKRNRMEVGGGCRNKIKPRGKREIILRERKKGDIERWRKKWAVEREKRNRGENKSKFNEKRERDGNEVRNIPQARINNTYFKALFYNLLLLSFVDFLES